MIKRIKFSYIFVNKKNNEKRIKEEEEKQIERKENHKYYLPDFKRENNPHVLKLNQLVSDKSSLSRNQFIESQFYFPYIFILNNNEIFKIFKLYC